MTARTDHTKESERHLRFLGENMRTEEFAFADLNAKEAQVHATLALVEQQRIANLIAYATHRNDHQIAIGNHYPDALRELLSDVDFGIREGLGL